MYTSTDLDKLRQIMAESPEHTNIISRLLTSHREAISTITHEIRNPLTLVYSSLQLIESAHPEVHTFRHWDTMHQDVLYMMQLLADLSAYNNGFSLHKQPLNTRKFLKELVLSFAASSEASDIEFTSCIAPELPLLQADATKLKEVLLNLLKNAFEAIPSDTPGSVRLDADMITSADPSDTAITASGLRIQIRDNGCGIPAERLDKIFIPFVTFKTGGTGLGLPLSRRIIEAHNGTLRVKSSLDTGTVFTILIPASPTPAPTAFGDTE